MATDDAGSSPPSIRRLYLSDIPIVAGLWHEGWHDAHAEHLPPEIVAMRSRETFEQRLWSAVTENYVVDDGGSLIGYAGLYDHKVDQLYVARHCRGTGLAQRFLTVLEDVLRGRGYGVAELQCAPGNQRARRFYWKCGWYEAGIYDQALWMPDARIVTHPTVIFEKRLV